MPLSIFIPDDDLAGFSPPALAQTQSSITTLANDLISEANRLEAINRPSNEAADVSADMVRTAEMLLRRGVAQKKKSLGVRLFRIGPVLMIFLTQFFWDKGRLQDSSYLIIFGVVAAITIVWTTAVALMD
jgi:hypothetical protein